MQVEDSIVDALAVARLARLAHADTITEPLRSAWVAAAYRRSLRSPLKLATIPPSSWPHIDPDAPLAAKLVTCRWCLAMWCAAFVVAARATAPRLWDPVARTLAASHLAGLSSLIDQ